MRYVVILSISLLVLCLLIQSTLNSADKPGDSPLKFTEVTESLGFSKDGAPAGYWGDYNNDGYQDVLSGRDLSKNSGSPDWRFDEVMTQVGVKTEKDGAARWLDYNNDGNLDLLIVTYGTDGLWKKTLWRNTGKPKYHFVDVSKEQPGLVADKEDVCCVAMLDYDRDGYLDIYITGGEKDMVGLPDRLFHNEKGTFVDVTKEMGLRAEKNSPRVGRAISIGDYNNDGLMDIYVCNYRLAANYLWELQKDGTFKDVAEARNVAGINRQGCFGHSIVSACGDINNDGYLDLVVGNLAHKDPQRGPICDDSKIYLNLGPEEGYKFKDIREAAGFPIKPVGGEEEMYGGVLLGDFDNDGLLDLYLTHIYDLPYAWSRFYHNESTEDGVKFRDIAQETKTRVRDTYSCSVVDYNNDGKLDLIAKGKFFRNETANNNKWLEVKLIGTHCNKLGMGARITIYYGKQLQMREVTASMGAFTQTPLVAHFGLGQTNKIDRMEIRWPCGKVQKLDKPAINKLISVEEK
jgi:hypothetical protein